MSTNTISSAPNPGALQERRPSHPQPEANKPQGKNSLSDPFRNSELNQKAVSQRPQKSSQLMLRVLSMESQVVLPTSPYGLYDISNPLFVTSATGTEAFTPIPEPWKDAIETLDVEKLKTLMRDPSIQVDTDLLMIAIRLERKVTEDTQLKKLTDIFNLLATRIDLPGLRGYYDPALHFAVKVGSILLLQALIKNGAQADIQNMSGQTTLYRAVHPVFSTTDSQLGMIKILLENGANQNRSTNRPTETPFTFASKMYTESPGEKNRKTLVLGLLKAHAKSIPLTIQALQKAARKGEVTRHVVDLLICLLTPAEFRLFAPRS